MLTYEYRCQKCGHQFERSQGINDAPVRRCPRCGGRVQRLITGGRGFMFKGGSPTSKIGDSTPQNSASCCGTTNPCSDPKRCCGR
jgi:putative FmdB family regulatory protein